MANLKLDRKKPDVAIPQLEKAINNLFPVGMRVRTSTGPPEIGTWKIVSTIEDLTEYERVR